MHLLKVGCRGRIGGSPPGQQACAASYLPASRIPAVCLRAIVVGS